MGDEEIFFLLLQVFWLCIPVEMKADTEQTPDGTSEMAVVYPRKGNPCSEISMFLFSSSLRKFQLEERLPGSKLCLMLYAG